MASRFNVSELIIIAMIAVFGVFWVIWMMPFLSTSAWFAGIAPIWQYLIFNLGFILLITVTFGSVVSLLRHQRFDLWEMIKSGLASFIVFSFIFDLWQPPYYIGVNGTILITNTGALAGTAVDAALYYVWTLIGINPLWMIDHVAWIYICVYFFSPIIAGFLAAILFDPEILYKMVGVDIPKPVDEILDSERCYIVDRTKVDGHDFNLCHGHLVAGTGVGGSPITKCLCNTADGITLACKPGDTRKACQFTNYFAAPPK
jgi:hypothetical protein